MKSPPTLAINNALRIIKGDARKCEPTDLALRVGQSGQNDPLVLGLGHND